MKISSLLSLLAPAAAALGAWTPLPAAAATIDSSFTYQGQLNDTNGPVNGDYDFSFRLFRSATAASAAYGPITNLDVAVTNGRFATSLNFGANVFDGTAYWLQIDVRTNTTNRAASFVALSPRQTLTAAPYALHATQAGVANNALTADSAAVATAVATNSVTAAGIADATITAEKLNPNIGLWTKSGMNIYYDAGHVGIGATNPVGPLEVVGFSTTGPEALDQQVTVYTLVQGTLDQWQSFTPDASGALTLIELYVGSPSGDSWPGTIQIYAGQGTAGTLLATESVTFVNPSGFQSFPLTSPPQVQAGSKYTIRFSVSPPPLLTAWVWLNSNNSYAGGRASFNSSWDYLFKTRVTPNTWGTSLAVVNGNVGIGTNAPTEKLHVNGDILASGAIFTETQILPNPGTVGAPSFAFRGDNDTGIFRPANNQIALSTAGNERLRITGAGVGIGTNAPASALHVVGTVTATAFNPPSDRHLKENFAPVSPRDVLRKVTGLNISRWNFIGDATTPHVGPMAQDFHAAFGLGTDDRHIATVDADGVALAAIQGLNQKVEEKDARLRELEQRLEKLERLINSNGGVAR